MCVSHFLYICLFRCSDKFYFHCHPKVPGTEWMPKACLFSEWMKTVKIMNEKQWESCVWWGTITGQSQSEDGDSRGQQILTVVGERDSSGRGCLPALLLQPAQILRPWPGNTWLAHTNSKDRSAFVWGYHTESYQLCLLSSGHSWIPPFWFSVIAPAPQCAHERGVSFLFVTFTS